MAFHDEIEQSVRNPSGHAEYMYNDDFVVEYLEFSPVKGICAVTVLKERTPNSDFIIVTTSCK